MFNSIKSCSAGGVECTINTVAATLSEMCYFASNKAINQQKNEAVMSFLPLYLMRVSGSSAVNETHDSYIPNIALLTVNLKARTIVPSHSFVSTIPVIHFQ